MPVLNPMIARTKPIEKSAPKLPHITNIPTINRSSTQSSLYKAEKKSRTVDEKERLKPSKSSSMLLSKTDPRLQKTSSGLSGALSEKERRNSEVLIDSETKRQSVSIFNRSLSTSIFKHSGRMLSLKCLSCPSFPYKIQLVFVLAGGLAESAWGPEVLESSYRGCFIMP